MSDKVSVFSKLVGKLILLLGCGFYVLFASPQISDSKTLTKVALSTEATSTGLPDLFTGTMSYSIPIEVPVGRKGMDPGLSLNYRSGNDNGVVGVGWELELGSIQRAPTGGAVNFSGDSYLLTSTGSSSSLISVGAGIYQAKIEGGFSRIQQVSTANGPYWVVTDKAGVRFFYGQSVASRQDDSGSISRIFKWNLDRIEDTNGNNIAITYFKNLGQIYLDKIEYTGNSNASLLPTSSIKFSWEGRTDTNPSNATGFSVTTANRLTIIAVETITSATTTATVRTYVLDYVYSSFTNSYNSHNSLLNSVKQLGNKICKTCYPIIPDTHLVRSMGYEQQNTAYAEYLTNVTNNFGGSTAIAYEAAVLTGTSDPAQNVASISVTDGNNNTSTTYYQYTGGYYYNSNGIKEFRGFNKVEVKEPVAPGVKQKRTVTYFHQGDELDLTNNPGVATGITKGKPYSTRTYTASGVSTGNENFSESQMQKLAETTISYDPKSLSTPYFTPVKQVDSYFYDTESGVKHSKVIYENDSLGNIITEYRYGDIDNSDDDFTIYRSYSANTSSWPSGLPISESIFSGIGTSNKIAASSYYYDGGVTSCDIRSTNQAPDKGRLTRVERWLYYDGETDSTIEQRMAYDDATGNMICRRDPKGYTSSIGYDLTSKTYPTADTNYLGQQILTKYYGIDGVPTNYKGLYGQVLSVTDPNGASTTKEYDNYGRLRTETNAEGAYSYWTYNNFGLVGSQNVRVNTSDGLWSENYFDGVGRTYLRKTNGPESKTIETKTEYDNRGNVRKKSLPYFTNDTPQYILTEYDAIGRVVKTGLESTAENIRPQTCYNKDVTVNIDPNHHRRRELRDPSGRLIKVQEYTGTFSSCSTEEGSPYSSTTYQYDVLGNLRFVTDANGNQTEMRYDSLGRKRYMSDPDMGIWIYTYDANGNLETQTDAKWQVITFGYDALNRLTTKKHGALLVLTNYYDETGFTNPIGRLTRMVDATGESSYNYDKMGRATSTSKNIGGTAYSLGFSFLNGRLAGVTYPDSETVSYTYDAGVLKGVTGYIGYSNFDAIGRPWNATYGTGGASSLYTFSTDTQRLLTLSVVSPNQGLLIDNSYGYDNKGNVTSTTDSLNKALPTNFSSETYTLDANRAHAVGSTGSGRLFQYDGNGNITNDGQRGISYNYDNMPTSVNSTSFAYDGNSTRIMKNSPDRTTVYIDKLFECTNGACSKFIFAGNSRIALKSGSQTLYYHPDHQGSTSVVTNAAGNKAEDIAYYPFGGTRQESGSTSVSHKYTGQEKDSETGLYNYNARLYDADLGRFMSPDSIVPDPSNPQSLNRYSYVLNNPINLTDPTGHSWKWLKDRERAVRHWANDHVDFGGGVGAGFSGNMENGNVNVNIGPGSTNPGSSATANNNASQGISINIYNSSTGFASTNSMYSQLSNSLGNNSGYPQLSLGYGGFGGGNTSSSGSYTYGGGIMITGGGTIEAGAGNGGAFQATSGVGVFASPAGVNAGGFTSSGGFAGNGNVKQFVAGATGGVGSGILLTNATNANQLLGPFDTWSLNLPLFSAQFATDGTNRTLSGSIGRSLGVSMSRYSVTTTSTGCFGWGCK